MFITQKGKIFMNNSMEIELHERPSTEYGNHKLHVIFLMITCILIILGNTLNSLFLYAAVIMSVCIMMFSTVEDIYYFGLFLIPNIRIFDNLGVTFIINLLLSIPAIRVFLKNCYKINGFSFSASVTLFVIELIRIVVVGNFNSIPSVISIFMGTFFCIYITCSKIYTIDIKRIWNYLSLGIYVSTATYLITNPYMATHLVQSVISNHRLAAYANDPNYFSLYICICLSLFFLLSKIKVRDIIREMILMGIGFLTGSKMCLLLMMGIVVAGVGTSLNESKTKRRGSLFLVLVLCVTFFAFRTQIEQFIQNFLNRSGLGSGTINLTKLTSDRFDIGSFYINQIVNNMDLFFFGRGLEYYHAFDSKFQIAHNTYLDIILSWGIIGIICCIIIFYGWICHIKINHNISIKTNNMLPLAVLLLSSLALSYLGATMSWWIFSVVIVSLISDKSSIRTRLT